MEYIDEMAMKLMKKKYGKKYIAWGLLCLALVLSSCGNSAAIQIPADPDSSTQESESSAEAMQQEGNQSGLEGRPKEQEVLQAERWSLILELHLLNEVAADALSCKAFYNLPVSREQLDLARIMEDDQRGISWSSVEIEEESRDGLFSFQIQYIIFDTLPDVAFTDTINQIIRNSVCFSYDNYDETNKVYTNHGQYGERNSGSVTVLFAHPELVCVQIEIPAGYSGKGTKYNHLLFNSTTGQRYRLHNFVEVSPDFAAKYIIQPQQNASHDLKLINDIYEQAGMDGLNEILSGDSPTLEEFWDIDMAQWFVGRYLEFFDTVDNDKWDCFWVDDGQLWIRSGFDNLMEERAISFSELAPYFYMET